MRYVYRALCVALLVPLCCVPSGCQEKSRSNKTDNRAPQESVSAREQADRPNPANDELDKFIRQAGQYLVKACESSGRFQYEFSTRPGQVGASRYNLLRHCGAIYALADFARMSGDSQARAAAIRAARYLKETSIRPVNENPNMTAVWTLSEVTGIEADPQAKLGGAGLALIALTQIERIAPGTTPVEELRKLARFVVFMQKPDGAFYSKFYPDQRQRDDRWTSLYYPGEAVLGLLMLYELDPRKAWLAAAEKGMLALARQRESQSPTPPDQWILLAAARMRTYQTELEAEQAWARIEAIAMRTTADMIQEQKAQLDHDLLAGCFTADGRSCPSATRLEGLLATRSWLAKEHELHRELEPTIRRGMEFLIRCQIQEGPGSGGMPCVLPAFAELSVHGLDENSEIDTDDPDPTAKDSRAAPSTTEHSVEVIKLDPAVIRIDYVQHAMSAALEFQRQFASTAKP